MCPAPDTAFPEQAQTPALALNGLFFRSTLVSILYDPLAWFVAVVLAVTVAYAMWKSWRTPPPTYESARALEHINQATAEFTK